VVGAAIPTWGTFSIPGGGSVSLTFTVSIAAATPNGTYQNPARAIYLDPARTTVGGTTSAAYAPGSSTGEDVTISGGPRVTIGRSVNPGGAVPPGTDLTYSITAVNTGTYDAVSVAVVDSIAGQVTFKLGSVVNTLPPGVNVTVAYSNNDGATWTYVPVSLGCAAPAGYDGCVNRIRWTLLNPLSAVAPNNSCTFQYVARIK
jgi:uncharacterized repeat protein (TIGR01451 family)